MRKWWWLLIIPVFAVMAIILPREKRPEMVQGESTVQAQEINPYTIEGMKARTYDSEISRENRVRETASFTSFKISFESDGLKQYALMNLPKGTPPEGGWPVVVVNHGYIEPAVYSTENSYINTSAYFADAGFLVRSESAQRYATGGRLACGRGKPRIYRTGSIFNRKFIYQYQCVFCRRGFFGPI